MSYNKNLERVRKIIRNRKPTTGMDHSYSMELFLYKRAIANLKHIITIFPEQVVIDDELNYIGNWSTPLPAGMMLDFPDPDTPKMGINIIMVLPNGFYEAFTKKNKSW